MAADAGEVWGIESVGDAVADAELNADENGIDNARFRRRRRPARDPAAGRGGRQAGRRRDRSAPSRPLGEDRPPRARVRGESGSSTSPATRRRSRPNAAADGRRRRLQAAAAPGPWTCSPRPPTSSASRCSKESSTGPALGGRGFAVAAGLDPDRGRPARRPLRGSSATSRCGATTTPPSAHERQRPADAGGAGGRQRLAAARRGRRSPSTATRPAAIAAAVERVEARPRPPGDSPSAAGRSNRPLQPRGRPRCAARSCCPARDCCSRRSARRCARSAAPALDGVLFNWMTPALIAGARERVAARRRATAGRPPPQLFGYVRAAVGADAETRLARDEGFYRGLHRRLAQSTSRASASDPGADRRLRRLPERDRHRPGSLRAAST